MEVKEKKFISVVVLCLVISFLTFVVGCSKDSSFIGITDNNSMSAKDYNQFLKQHYPKACIISTFNDPRSAGKYRKTAGVHYGYDFLLPAGADVPAGWSGKVTAIYNWGYGEYGVQVTDGSRMVQYGHIVPTVRIGDKIEIGTIVGRTKISHVDVKMKVLGDYYDFGSK